MKKIIALTIALMAATAFANPGPKNGWDWMRETPELSVGGYAARPQAVHVMTSGDLLITAHFQDQFSRAYVVPATGTSVTGWFDFPSPYAHIASVSERSNGDVWFADYATGDIIRVDVANSLVSNTADILEVRHVMPAGVLSGIEWVTIGSEELLLLAEYRTTGAPLMYVIGEHSLRKLTITQRLQGIAYRNGVLYVISNRLTSGSSVGTMQEVDLPAFISSSLHADTWTNYVIATSLAPSNYPEDLAFDSTGKLYTLTEGNTSVGTPTDYLALWSTTP